MMLLVDEQGEAGVSNVLRILNEELRHAMLFSGTATLADIGYVEAVMYCVLPMKLTAFMLFGVMQTCLRASWCAPASVVTVRSVFC